MQQDRRAGALGERGGGVDVVVVGVGGDDGEQPASAERRLDRRGVVGRVDHHGLGVVADDPDVVLHLPAAAVEFEGAGGDEPVDPEVAGAHRTTTERSTSPWCMRSNACSTASSSMVSLTNAPRSRRPWR